MHELFAPLLIILYRRNAVACMYVGKKCNRFHASVRRSVCPSVLLFVSTSILFLNRLSFELDLMHVGIGHDYIWLAGQDYRSRWRSTWVKLIRSVWSQSRAVCLTGHLVSGNCFIILLFCRWLQEIVGHYYTFKEALLEPGKVVKVVAYPRWKFSCVVFFDVQINYCCTPRKPNFTAVIAI